LIDAVKYISSHRERRKRTTKRSKSTIEKLGSALRTPNERNIYSYLERRRRRKGNEMNRVLALN